MTTKFSVLQTEVSDLSVSILGTFLKRENAIDFMTNHIDETHDILDGWVNLVHENRSTISVYNRGIMFGKSLISKFHIIEYQDETQSFCPSCGELKVIEIILDEQI